MTQAQQDALDGASKWARDWQEVAERYASAGFEYDAARAADFAADYRTIVARIRLAAEAR